MSSKQKNNPAKSTRPSTPSPTDAFPENPKNQIAGGTADITQDPPARSSKPKDINEATADALEEYIRQFEDTYFSQVVKLGDPKKYRDAISQTTIIPHAKFDEDAIAQLAILEGLFDAPFAEMRLRFNPLGILVPKQKQTLFHETTHLIEWLHGDQRDKSDPTAERNTGYIDRLFNLLSFWKRMEGQLIKGVRTPAETQSLFSHLEDELAAIEKEFKPDFPQLQVWAGIYSIPASGKKSSAGGIRFADIRDHYLNCDSDVLRELASNHQTPPGDPGDWPVRIGCNGWNHPLACPCDFPPRRKNLIAGGTVDLSP